MINRHLLNAIKIGVAAGVFVGAIATTYALTRIGIAGEVSKNSIALSAIQTQLRTTEDYESSLGRLTFVTQRNQLMIVRIEAEKFAESCAKFENFEPEWSRRGEYEYLNISPATRSQFPITQDPMLLYQIIGSPHFQALDNAAILQGVLRIRYTLDSYNRLVFILNPHSRMPSSGFLTPIPPRRDAEPMLQELKAVIRDLQLQVRALTPAIEQEMANVAELAK